MSPRALVLQVALLAVASACSSAPPAPGFVEVSAGPELNVESSPTPAPSIPSPPPAVPVTIAPPTAACYADTDCAVSATAACRRTACVAGTCAVVPDVKGAECASGLCDGAGACVKHFAVACEVSGKTYVGCDGRPGNTTAILYESPANGTTWCAAGDLGYCAPGAWCSVGGVAGQCQPLVDCAGCDEGAHAGACSSNFCDMSTGSCNAFDYPSGNECGSCIVLGTSAINPNCGACDGAGACH